MAYNTHRPTADKYLNAQLVDISAASIAYVAVPGQGVLVDVYCVIANAITGSDGTVTIKVDGTSVGTLTATVAGSAAGTVFTATFTGTEVQRTVGAASYITLDSDGVSSTTAVANFTCVIREL